MPTRLTESEIADRLSSLGSPWARTDAGHLTAPYSFANFGEALAFANAVGERAERANHHPDLHVGWGRCSIVLWTHDADGLTELDFALAREISACYDALP